MKMGVGEIGTTYRHKFKWTLEWLTDRYELIVPESFVKISGRPNLVVEEDVLTYHNQKMWIPGKSSWETMTATYLDVTDDEGGAIFAYWMTQQYQQMPNNPVARPELAIAVLRLYDGCGGKIETWELENAMVSGLSFGDLDHSAADPVLLEATIRYTKVYYESHCQSFAPPAIGAAP